MNTLCELKKNLFTVQERFWSKCLDCGKLIPGVNVLYCATCRRRRSGDKRYAKKK